MKLPKTITKKLTKYKEISYGKPQTLGKNSSPKLGYSYKPKKYGGLGLQKVSCKNKALLSKLAWKLLKKTFFIMDHCAY